MKLTPKPTRTILMVKALLAATLFTTGAFANDAPKMWSFNHRSPQYKKWMAARKALIAKQGVPEIWKSLPLINAKRETKNVLAAN